MIIKKIAFGDASEAFIEDRISSGFNIIFSDDNNKGKTIVMQSSLFAIGNEPIFPSSFNYKDYYHYVEVELDSGDILESCRKGKSFIIRINDSIHILDSVSELKRFLNRNGMSFPVIIKDNTDKMVDPVLLYQLFFVGQDNKNTASIFNDLYYKKEDFWNMVYAYFGIRSVPENDIDSDEIKHKIALLKEEKKVLLSQNEILKKANPSVQLISQKQGNDAFQAKLNKLDSIKDKIIETTKNRNRALQRKTVNEKTLKEIRSLNRSPDTGELYCLDCGSGRIGYSSGDRSYSFDISDTDMRSNIIESIQDKIDAYQEEIDECSLQLNKLQKLLQDLLKEDDVDLETVLMHKEGIVAATEADSRLVDIDEEIKTLQALLKLDKTKNKSDKKKKEELKNALVSEMNFFYRQVDPSGNNVFDDLFSKRKSVYSGVEQTEFYLSKLYALAKVLEHKYPIMMDYFRDGELSSEKEKIVLKLFGELPNQILFSATLKDEELGKYSNEKEINAIDYSTNTANHILSRANVTSFKKLLKPLMIKL